MFLLLNDILFVPGLTCTIPFLLSKIGMAESNSLSILR